MISLAVLVVLILLPPHQSALAAATPTTLGIRNHRRGDTNSSVDAHDGPIVRWSENGPFYRYAMSYTPCHLEGEPRTLRGTLRRWLNTFVQSVHGTGFNCGQIITSWSWLTDGFGNDCGFQTPSNGQTVNIYKSWDLVNWHYVRSALEGGPTWLTEDSILFRPAILRHPVTKQFVLWVNRLPRAQPVVESYRRAGFVVGTAATPEGPFQFAAHDAMPAMTYAGGADFSLLLDSKTNNAYIAYGSWHNYAIQDDDWRAKAYPEWMREGHQIAVQKLDPETFTKPDDSSPTVTVTKGKSQEAPSFFQRGDFYYLIYGNLCCFCERGSDAKVLVAQSPLGPYVEVAQLNDVGSKHHLQGQNSDIIEVEVVGEDGRAIMEYLWSIDMWFSGASGFKGDDHQYWEPLNFEETREIVFEEGGESVSVPIPRRMLPNGAFVDCFELGISSAANIGEVVNPCSGADREGRAQEKAADAEAEL